MVALVSTVAFLGLEARAVEVQVQVTPGLPAFVVVGLADKAVAESRERVRGALSAIGLSLPPKRNQLRKEYRQDRLFTLRRIAGQNGVEIDIAGTKHALIPDEAVLIQHGDENIRVTLSSLTSRAALRRET